MTERSNDHAPRPLPRDWLPDATPPDAAAEWAVRVQRIMAAAEPALAKLGNRDDSSDAGWPVELGSFWRPAAAVATAATLLLVVADKPRAVRESGYDGLPLSLMAAEGQPVALWEGLGIDADPVLALIALQEQIP